MWELLPDLILEDIFSYLTVRERYYASQVCLSWNRIFYSSRVWSTWIMKENVLTRRKFNYYMGYQPILDHYRTQICLHKVGRFFRKLLFLPMSNFFNLYEFMNMLSYFAEFFDENPLRFVHTLCFTFACRLVERGETDELVFGTGGKLLQSLKRLMNNLNGLQYLTLNDLLLDKREAFSLLDEIVLNCSQNLLKLRLVNCTRDPCPIMHVGVLLNLTELTISPQQLNDDVVILLGDVPLQSLHIVQNRFTEDAQPVSRNAWKECKKHNCKLQVHLRLEGAVKNEIVWQPNAPVKSIVYNSTKSQVTTMSLLTTVELYSNELEIYAHLCLPRFCMRRSFHDRCDSSLVLMCRQCPHLHTLVIRQLVSTATVILITWTAKQLRRLFVRRNAIMKRSDWPRSPDWTLDFYYWLTKAAQNYETMEKEVSQLLGYNWKAMTDQQFKFLEINYAHEEFNNLI